MVLVASQKFYFYLFIHLLAALGHCYMQAFSRCGESGPVSNGNAQTSY